MHHGSHAQHEAPKSGPQRIEIGIEDADGAEAYHGQAEEEAPVLVGNSADLGQMQVALRGYLSIPVYVPGPQEYPDIGPYTPCFGMKAILLGTLLEVYPEKPTLTRLQPCGFLAQLNLLISDWVQGMWSGLQEGRPVQGTDWDLEQLTLER